MKFIREPLGLMHTFKMFRDAEFAMCCVMLCICTCVSSANFASYNKFKIPGRLIQAGGNNHPLLVCGFKMI